MILGVLHCDNLQLLAIGIRLLVDQGFLNGQSSFLESTQSWQRYHFCFPYAVKSKIFSLKSYLQRGLNLGPLVIHCDAHLAELTWQVLIEGFNFTFVGAPIHFC